MASESIEEFEFYLEHWNRRFNQSQKYKLYDNSDDDEDNLSVNSSEWSYATLSPKPSVVKTPKYTLHGIPIRIVSNTRTLTAAIDKLQSYNPTHIGLDCEWKPIFHKGINPNPVALMQIACEKLIILVQIHKLKNVKQAFAMSGLSQLLKDRSIAKVGVGIQGDVDKMFADHRVVIKQCIDLNQLYCYAYAIRDPYFKQISLKRLFKAVCGAEMTYKTTEIACSNWETKELTKRQILYAADDAYAGYCIYSKLYKKKQKKIKSVRHLAMEIYKFYYEH